MIGGLLFAKAMIDLAGCGFFISHHETQYAGPLFIVFLGSAAMNFALMGVFK